MNIKHVYCKSCGKELIKKAVRCCFCGQKDPFGQKDPLMKTIEKSVKREGSPRVTIKDHQVVVSPDMSPGRWEYKEFTEVFSSDKYPENKAFPFHSGAFLQVRLPIPAPADMGRMPNYELEVLIEKAVRNLLTRAGNDGWEPMESVNAYSLWAQGRIQMEDVSSGFMFTTKVTPIKLTINFRRWVT